MYKKGFVLFLSWPHANKTRCVLGCFFPSEKALLYRFPQQCILTISASGQHDTRCISRKLLVYQAKVDVVKAVVIGWALQIASVRNSLVFC